MGQNVLDVHLNTIKQNYMQCYIDFNPKAWICPLTSSKAGSNRCSGNEGRSPDTLPMLAHSSEAHPPHVRGEVGQGRERQPLFMVVSWEFQRNHLGNMIIDQTQYETNYGSPRT